MISRRPKNRASSEKAPGPSGTSTIDITAKYRAINALSFAHTLAFSKQPTPITEFTIAMEVPAIGVRNPTRSAAAQTIVNKQTSQSESEVLLAIANAYMA